MALKDISNFRTSIYTDGILKSNKYIAEIKFPENHYLRSSLQRDEELIAVRCDSATLPAFSFSTVDGSPRLGYGPIERRPYSVNYDEMNLTFLVDGNSRLHKLFYDWANCIVNFQGQGGRILRQPNGPSRGNNTSSPWVAYEVGYHDNYKVDLFITVYQVGGDAKLIRTGGAEDDFRVGADVKAAMKIHVYEAFPLSFPPIQLNWEDHQPIKLSIPFGYMDFSVEYIKE